MSKKYKQLLSSLSFGSVLILLLISVLIFKACNDSDIEKSYISKEALYYIDFEPGSYWIYQDSISNQIDSVYLVSKENDFVLDDLYYEEENTYTYYSSYLNQTYTAKLSIANDSFKTYYSRDTDPVHIYVYYRFGRSVEFHSQLELYEVNNNTFHNVKHFIRGDLMDSYFAKNVGLIQFRYDYDHKADINWKILNYFIK